MQHISLEFRLINPVVHLGQSPSAHTRLDTSCATAPTGDVYLAVVFTLYLNEDVNEDGTLKPTAWETTVPHAREAEGGDDVIALDGHAEAFDEKKALDEAKRRSLAR